jgi:HAD superfamily hydrolase (TIGR01509 family)
MAIAHVIFDCDGVLVDSEPLSNRILAEDLTAIGLPTTTEESVRDFMGRSFAAGVALIEERLGHPVPPDFAERYHARLFEAFERELRPVPGVVEVLDRLALPDCVASSGDHVRIRRALASAGLLERFDGRIFSVEDVLHGKPAPDLFLHAAEAMGFEPACCAVVEDSPAGVQAGRAAGMTVLGYAGGSTGAELADAGAHATFTDMRELPDLLTRDFAPRSGAGR